MQHKEKFMFSKLIIGSGVLLCLASNAWAGEAGRVVFTTGQVQLGQRNAVTDAVVNEGDDIVTGTDGYVYIKTVDNGFLILRANSKARVTTYRIDGTNAGNTQVKLELLSGVARAISGTGVKAARQNFRFNTPVAAIGVRGTDFIVYTDQQTSRVLVVSGGVVMSGFGGGCKAEGVGPCEGKASRELFAGKAGMMLQVQRGEGTPQLLSNPALSPDQIEKPRPDEPAGKPTASTVPATPVNLDPQRSELSLRAVRPSTSGDPDTTTVVPPPVVEVPGTPVLPPVVTPPVVVPLPPKAQEIFWGRWQTVANSAVMPAAIADNNVDNPVFIDNYAIARMKGAQLVMPTEGTVAFNLANSEAFVQKAGIQSVATVDSGKLSINFVDRSFTTALGISSAGSSYDITGRGTVDYKGQMSSTAASSSVVRGFLSGANVEEAAYIFKNTAYPGTTITGATTWKR
jgi:hypothetical protein